MPFKRSIIILADGSRPDVLRELLQKGDLPNIKKHITDVGSFKTAATAFPSTTGPAHMPYLTGCLPATCNVPGIRWFDKKKYGKYGHGSIFSFGAHGRYRSYVGLETFRINSDMRNDVYNVFEIVPKSYSIFNSINRGIGKRNLTKIMRIWYWYYGHLTDRWKFVDDEGYKKILKAVEGDFEFLFAVLPGIDEYAHFAHYKHESCLGQYSNLDKGVGEIVAKLKKLGRFEETLIWIVSDHGLTPTHTHFCVNTFLESRGIKTFYFPLIHRKGFAAVNMVSGNSMTHLYFKKGERWQDPAIAEDINEMYPDLLNDLIKEPAVDILAVKNGNGEVVVRSKRGTVRMKLAGNMITYIVNGSDPFGYNLGENVTLTTEEFLSKTINTDYPDAPYQLLHIFTSPRCGDVILSATPGYDLRDKYEDPEHKGSHGSLHREHMLVPVLCNTKLADREMRTVDVFPTYLKLMGYEVPANIDGTSLI